MKISVKLQFLCDFLSQRLSRAATAIQAFYRGSRQRQRLKQAELGIILLQRKFRQRRLDKERTKEKGKRREERKLALEQKRINEFRSSMQKQLKMLESVPAREVNLFMEENQVKAASKIQAAFRGMVARKKYRERNEEVTLERAAVTIQRQVSVGIFIFGNFSDSFTPKMGEMVRFGGGRAKRRKRCVRSGRMFQKTKEKKKVYKDWLFLGGKK